MTSITGSSTARSDRRSRTTPDTSSSSTASLPREDPGHIELDRGDGDCEQSSCTFDRVGARAGRNERINKAVSYDIATAKHECQTVAAWHDEILRQVQNTIGFVMRLNSSAQPGAAWPNATSWRREIEAAIALENSPATVKRDWLVARAWLHRELCEAPKDR